MQEVEIDIENILLIIDDEDDIRMYVKSIFEQNFKVIEAEDGEQGLEMASKYLPNIVIADVGMPVLDGFELCQKMKANENTSHIPLIFLTARADQESKLQGLLAGATDFISKPFLAEELKIKVNNLIVLQKNVLKFLNEKVIEKTANEIAKPKSIEEIFLEKVNLVMQENYDIQEFDLDKFGAALLMSPVQLRRKLKAITGFTVVEYLRNYRLAQAQVLLAQQGLTISEIAYAVGFDSLSYFSRVFQEQFGVSPKEYRAQL